MASSYSRARAEQREGGTSQNRGTERAGA